MAEKKQIIAFELHDQLDMPIVPAPIDRDWMDRSPNRYAYRCLPLNIANQAGWMIPCPTTFSAIWIGGQDKRDLEIRMESEDVPSAPLEFGFSTTTVASVEVAIARESITLDSRIMSHFGCGVITFSLPYLFRTPPGVNLWVKGPSNWIKDGAHPLEGIIETDWVPASFTMNWKLTRPGVRVTFHRGEPICMLVPVPRGLAESLEPIRRPIADDPDVERKHQAWASSRASFLTDLDDTATEAAKRGWQKHYFQGTTGTGERAPEHQTKLDIREFRRIDEE